MVVSFGGGAGGGPRRGRHETRTYDGEDSLGCVMTMTLTKLEPLMLMLLLLPLWSRLRAIPLRAGGLGCRMLGTVGSPGSMSALQAFDSLCLIL